MSYRRIPVIHAIEIEEYEGLHVRMKSLKVGKMRNLVQQLEDDEISTPDLLDATVKAVTEALVSWDLEDESGNPVPATAEEVEELDFDMLQSICSAWLGAISGPSEELGKGSGSGETSPVELPTMEAL